MHQVWKLDGVLNKEDGHVVAHQVPVAFVGIKLDGKTAHITGGVFGAPFACDCRKAHKHRCDLSGFLKRCRLGVLGKWCVAFKKTMRTRTTCVNDSLRNSFVVKVSDFFAQNKVFQQSWPPDTKLQGILVVCYGHALVSGEVLA